MKTIKIVVSLLLFIGIGFSTAFAEEKQRAVLVTGASSGIGAEITKHLSENGFYVYAGARKNTDLERLNGMDNVSSVRLDVTVQNDIDSAVEFVRKQGRGLYGLINNAGIVILGPLTEVPLEEVEFQFDVNVFGPYRITQAFAPFIIESQGRISNISSISGILSSNMFGMYSMSKHAIEAYSDSLANELRQFGVKVSAIEPGAFKSNIGKTFSKRLESKKYLSKDSIYKEDLENLASSLSGNEFGKEPTEVAEAVFHALSSDSPKQKYMVTPNAQQAQITIEQAMREMLQLNKDHLYSLSTEELSELLNKMAEEINQ